MVGSTFKFHPFALNEIPGFNAGGSNMVFENNYIQNGDDCLTVGGQGKNIYFKFVP